MRTKANMPSGSDEQQDEPASLQTSDCEKNTPLFVQIPVLWRFCYLWSSINNRIVQDKRLYLKVWTSGSYSYNNGEFSVISDFVQIPGHNPAGVQQHKTWIITGHQAEIGCWLFIHQTFQSSFSLNMFFPSPSASPIQSPIQSLTEMAQSVSSGAMLWPAVETSKHLPTGTLDAQDFDVQCRFDVAYFRACPVTLSEPVGLFGLWKPVIEVSCTFDTGLLLFLDSMAVFKIDTKG